MSECISNIDLGSLNIENAHPVVDNILCVTYSYQHDLTSLLKPHYSDFKSRHSALVCFVANLLDCAGGRLLHRVAVFPSRGHIGTHPGDNSKSKPQAFPPQCLKDVGGRDLAGTLHTANYSEVVVRKGLQSPLVRHRLTIAILFTLAIFIFSVLVESGRM